MPSSLPHSHLSMRSAIQTGVRGSIRPGRGAYRADLAPVGFNTAPSQRAGNRRSNRYAAFGHSIVFSMTIPLRYASVTAPASKGQVPRRQLRYAASGLSIDTLWTQGASKVRSDRRLLFQLSPMKRPLRARDPNGSCAFAVAPYCGGSYLTPAKWQIRDGSCSQKPRTRSRTAGVDSSRLRRDPPHGFSFHKRVARPSLSSAKNSPTARSPASRLRFAGSGAVGPQGACQAPPSVRAQSSAPTAVGACFAR